MKARVSKENEGAGLDLNEAHSQSCGERKGYGADLGFKDAQ